MIYCCDPKEGYLAHKQEIDRSVENVLRTGRYILGNEVSQFEEEFASYLGVKHAIGVGSGTDALYIALRVLDIGAGDEVITVAHTAVATVAAVTQCGAKPVFVDIDPDYFTADVTKIERLITNRTKAIVIVHLYGQPANIFRIKDIAEKYNLKVIEDCAQAHGARISGMKVGTIGDVGCFSFYPTKNLGAFGDGGLIATNISDIYEKSNLYRQYGWNERYVSSIKGYNSRLDEVHAAVLRVKLKYLDTDNSSRRQISELYNDILNSLDEIVLPKVLNDAEHVFHLYVIKTTKRDELKDYLLKNNIMALVHYPVPVHLQPAYVDITSQCSLKNTERICKEILSLPVYPQLAEEQVYYIVKVIKKFFSR